MARGGAVSSHITQRTGQSLERGHSFDAAFGTLFRRFCMKRQIIFGTLFSAALAVGVTAQEPTPSPGQPGQPPSSQSADAARTVTMAGCLQASSGAGGAGAAAATPAPSTPSQSSGGFILA